MLGCTENEIHDIHPIKTGMTNLSFRFTEESRELFHGLTLTIRKGERIGIRGASGAGKTTLFNLLLGLYEPTSGEIAVDGTPLTAANRRAWQNRIGYVSQRLFLTDGTFAANVAPGVPAAEIDRRRVTEALEAASWANSSLRCPWGSTPPSANAAAASRADSGSASASHAPSTAAPTCFSSTRRPRRSTAAPKGRSTVRSPRSPHGIRALRCW